MSLGLINNHEPWKGYHREVYNQEDDAIENYVFLLWKQHIFITEVLANREKYAIISFHFYTHTTCWHLAVDEGHFQNQIVYPQWKSPIKFWNML